MEPLWTWGGTFFGHRDGDDLWTYDGRHVGRFDENEIYGPDGFYLGETKNGNRLITSLHKKSWRKGCFIPSADRIGAVPHIKYSSFMMFPGYEDFPSSKEFK